MRTILRPFVLLSLALCTAPLLIAQDDNPFKEGSVFTVAMIRTEANSQEGYLKKLNDYWYPMMTTAKEQGLITSFSLLAGEFANQDDYDVMMLVEYPNLAAMDPDPAREAKWKAIRDALDAKVGGKDKVNAMTEQFGQMREYMGNKVMREMLPK
ncbi:MAG: hypothetical protein IPG69_17450 [Flavobacteriales bacterium]|jgi:hypothetical protein|nr:hypothetical protein [Flavobacteriales bacterium]MBK7269438.1 hypothetical protein [Flavobacteriales bacterium]MBK7753765.1 hypothetical protein [Flavobacteriales bacterium]MBK9075122.1 hypothetical protein [Flavobacteriales bacterium]MBK9540317.1 hypothetical protein [Flavobacteriales bacterium]